jgi:hypothetical protein
MLIAGVVFMQPDERHCVSAGKGGRHLLGRRAGNPLGEEAIEQDGRV